MPPQNDSLIEDANLTLSLLELERGGKPLFNSDQKSQDVALLGTARNTAAATVILVLAEAMGTGVFGLPGAAAHLGWMLSIFALVLLAVAAFYSSVLLAEVKLVHPEVSSYADAAHLLYGPWFGYFTQGCILLSWGFELIYFLIVTADTVALITDDYPGVIDHQWQKTLIAAALIVIPVQCRDYHAISYFTLPSTIAVVVAGMLILVNIGNQGLQFGAKTSAAPVAGSTIVSQFRALANFIQAYQSQSSFFEIMREMKEPTKIRHIPALANGVMLGFYSVTVVVAYGYQGTDTNEFLPAGMSAGPLKTLTAVLLIFHLVIVYVMSAQPFTRFLHATLFPRTLDRRTVGGVAHWALLSLSYLGICYVVAISIPFFANVQALSGALFSAPIIFGWPALFYAAMCYRAAERSRRGTLEKMGPWHVLLCGVFLFVCTPLFFGLGSIATSCDLSDAVAKSKPPFS